MSRVAQSYVRAGMLIVGVVAVDQLSKRLVQDRITEGDSNSVFIGINFVHVKNKGVAFGAFSGRPVVMIIVLLALAGLIVWFALHADRRYVWIPTGLLLGGALGNILDRVRDGAVTDFIKLPLWPAFNVADMAITAGVIALVVSLDAVRGH